MRCGQEVQRMNSAGKFFKRRVLSCEDVELWLINIEPDLEKERSNLLYDDSTHAMADKNDPSRSLPDTWVVLHLPKQRQRKVLYAENAVLHFLPVCFIAEAVQTDTLEVGIFGEPFLRPIMPIFLGFGPCLPRSTTKTVDKN
jgi:hypothetical protein